MEKETFTGNCPLCNAVIAVSSDFHCRCLKHCHCSKIREELFSLRRCIKLVGKIPFLSDVVNHLQDYEIILMHRHFALVHDKEITEA